MSIDKQDYTICNFKVINTDRIESLNRKIEHSNRKGEIDPVIKKEARMTRAPILAVILRTSGDDWKYQLYSAAYGLEMNIDNDWNARLVLLAPHDYLKAITEDTDVTGDDSAIVSAGVTDIPLDNSEPVISFVKQNHNNWLLVGHPAGNDSDAQINLKLKNVLFQKTEMYTKLH